MAKQINIAILTTLDAKGAREAQQWIAQLTQATKQASASASKGGGDPFKATADGAARAEKDILRYASAMASAQRATGDAAGGAQTMRAALAQMTPNTIEAHRATTQLAQAQAAASKSTASFAQQLSSSLKGSLLSVVGPAAAAGTALAVLNTVMSKAEEAFQWKATMDATTASINAQLKGLRDSNQVYAEAAAFGREFKLTQLEQAQAIQGAIGIIRQSKAPIEDILSVLARMQVLSPEQSLQEAAIALKALASGDTTSLVTRFEVGRDVANQMKQEIQGGADAVAVMSKFLADSGIGMEALKARSEGAAGAIKDAAIEQERLNKAIAGEEGGLGLALIQAKTTATQGLANALSSNSDALYAAAKAQDSAYNAALRQGATEAEAARVALEAYEETLRRLTPITEMVAPALDAASKAALQAAEAARQHTGGIYAEIAAATAHETVTRAEAAALADSTVASQADTAAKETLTAQTQLLEAQNMATVNAFLALNPNLQASGAAAAAGAAGFSPLIARLIEATLRANETRNALALLNAMAGIKATGGAMASAKRQDMADIQAQKHDVATAARQRGTAAATAAAEAERRLQSVQGNEIPTIQHLRAEAEALKKTRGAGSADYINKLADIAQAEQRAASAAKKGGGGGASGGAARETAAEKTGGRLQDIERTTGQKLADIEENTQQKLAAIDEKYAEQRAQAAQALADQIAEANAGERVSQTLNNFEQFGKDMTDAQKAAFAEREAAEVRYNERVAAAQEQARQEATNGDAALAADKLKIRTDEAKRQMEIEQRAAQANAETEGKQADAVAATAAQATAASKAEADTQIAIAEAKAAEKAGAQQAEKDAVIAAANEQRDKVVSAAEEQAGKVKGASDSQKSTVIGNLRAQADAAAAWASSIASSARTAQNAMAGVTGPSTGGGDTDTGGNQAAGGGTFVTRGRTTLTVGDNPGGAELVHVVPLSGKGTTRVGSGMARMAGGGTLVAGGGGSPTIASAISTFTDAAAIINILKPFVAANKGVLQLLNQYKSIVTAAVGSLLAIQDLRERLVMPSPVLDPAVVMKLKSDVELVLNMMIAIDASAIKKTGVFAKYLTAEKSAIEILTQMQDLRDSLATPTPPIDAAYVQALMRDAKAVLDLLLGSFIPLKQRQLDDLKIYAESEGASVAILTGIADLRTKLSGDTGTAFNLDLLRGLAKRAADITRMVQMQLVPLTEAQAAGFTRFAEAAGAAVQILTDVADLRKRLSEDTGTAFNMDLIRGLAMRAAQILQIVRAQLVPTTEEQADAMQRYVAAAGAGVEILSGVADLRKQLSEDTGGPLDMRLIARLALEARQILQIVQAQLIPTTEEQSDGLSTYASAAGSAVAILRDVAGLRKDAAELAGPVPVQAVVALASEAKQITTIVKAVLIPTTEEQAAGLSQYAEAVSATVGVVRDVVGLRKDAAELSPPIPEAAIIRLADDAKRIAQIVTARMVPASEEEAAAARRYADTTGAAVSALKSVLDMPAKLFADYRSPSDAQIALVVKDANRIVRSVDMAARAYDTKGLDAAKAFSEAVGGTFTAFKDGLLFFEALNSGDFRLDPKNLTAFEAAMGSTMATAGRLGAQAVAIPAANIAALQNVTAALTAAYESMIKLGAVPAGNLAQLAQQFGGAVGGGGGQTINVNIYNPPVNLNVPALIAQVKQGVAQSLGARR